MKYMNFLAADLGSSNGCVVLGEYNGEKLRATEVHRFENNPVSILGHNYWDILRLFFEVTNGIAAYHKKYRKEIKSIGIDAWGNDFAMFCRSGHLISNPSHYRNSHTEGILSKTEHIISEKEIFEMTGIRLS